MRIETLSLKGLTTFRDVVTLDFRELPPGLIAIVGENGAGKTTLLEAMVAAVHRSFASRDGELYDYATGRDSFIETQVALDGCGVFRARVNIDGPKRTSDAVLTAIRPDGVFTLNDGRVSDFDRAVAQHFPAKGLLLASAFASQNKTGSFITLDKKDRKALFMRLLSIERYQTMSETARQAASLVDQARGRLQAVRDELARGTAADLVDELDRLANQLQVEGGKAETQRVTLKAALAALEDRLALVQDQVTAHATASQFVRAVETEIAGRRQELDRLKGEHVHARAQAADARAKLATQRTERIADIDTLIGNNRKLIENRAGVEAAIAAVDAANARLAENRASVRSLQPAMKALANTEAALNKEERDLERTYEQLNRAQADSGLLSGVPCGGVGTYAPCRFLTNAKEAEAKIPALRQAVNRLPDVRASIEETKKARAAHEATVLAWQLAIDTDAAIVVEQGKLAALRDKVAAADARIDELQTKRVETIAAFAAAEVENTTRETTALARIADRVGIVDAELVTLGQNLVAAQADLATSAEGNRQAVALQVQIAEARAKWDVTTGTLARVEAGHADLERRRAEMSARRQRLAAVDSTATTLADDLLGWQFLAKGLGPTGLPVLEIDAAGPTISAYTNELLTVCFGARFSVELVTQREKADGKGYVDDFSVQVFDNAAGGDARDIADLSGGEQVIVAEALMNAISIYVNTTSPIPVRTCWRDETTGALDPENTQRYLAMLRKVQELGGFHHVFFISHNQDAAAQADAQIQVGGGKAAIMLPPFAAAEAA